MHKFLKLALAVLLLVGGVYLITEEFISWGILAILISILGIILFFRNEYILLAFWQLRKQNIAGAKKWLNKITNVEKQLFKGQYGYYNYMRGLTEAESDLNAAEKYMKTALKHGLMFGHDRAIAKLNLAAGMARKGNKKEAKRLLKEARQDDKQNLVSGQIDIMEQQLKKVQVSRNPRQQQMQRRGRYF